MKKYKAGQTIYIVQRDWDSETWRDLDQYKINACFIQEKTNN